MPALRRGGVDLPLAADRAGRAPLTAQIVGQLRAAMTDGQLAAGERLPSTRALAVTLGVSRTVVTGAYAQLFAEGWIEGRHGSGTYVADGTSASGGAGVSNGASTSGDTGASAGASVSSSASFSNGASVSNGSSVSGGASRADAGAGE